MPVIKMEIPIKTVSEANSSEHWTRKAIRHRRQQFFTRAAYNRSVKHLQLPCIVKLTRLSPRKLDDDNLRGAMKYIRDEVSECIIPEKAGTYVTKKGSVRSIKGRADSDPRITWIYEQEKAPRQGVRIEIDDGRKD